MPARSQLRRRCSPLARAWDLHIPAICDRRKLSVVPGGRRDEASVGTNALDLALPLAAGRTTRPRRTPRRCHGALRADVLPGSESPALAGFGRLVSVAVRHALLGRSPIRLRCSLTWS